jgi:hypothetical protein
LCKTAVDLNIETAVDLNIETAVGLNIETLRMGRRGTRIDYWWESQRERDH